MAFKECPECEKVFSGHKCGCGYGAQKVWTKQIHPDSLKCIWQDKNGRCQNVGTIADNPYEGSGEQPDQRRFYCSWHYECLKDSEFVRDKQQVDEYWKKISSYRSGVTLNRY